VTGGALWTDAQVTHCERLLMGFLHAAALAGATLANHAEVVSLLRDGARVTGARVRDHAGGAELDVRARLVLNAAGPDGAAILRLAGLERPAEPMLQAMNLVLRRPLLKGHALGVRSGGRHLFLVPWRDRSIVGTAYAPNGQALLARGFLAEAAVAFPWAGLDATDVTLVHRGRVPGHAADALLDRASIVDHEATDSVAGLVSALGVKYTTARAVAEKSVDIAVARIGRRVGSCRTAYTDLPAARPLTGTLEEQARHAVREEMAVHLADAVLRRLELGSAGLPEPSALGVVAAAMARELGWDGARVAEETRAVADAYRLEG
jgi:glycerol-3-phosphate dehydrogenase